MSRALRRSDELAKRRDSKPRGDERPTDAPNGPHEPEYPVNPDELASEMLAASGIPGQNEVYPEEVARPPTQEEARIVHRWWRDRARAAMSEARPKITFEKLEEMTGCPTSSLSDWLTKDEKIGRAWAWVTRVSEALGIPYEPEVPEDKIGVVNEVLAADPVKMESAAQLLQADGAIYEAMKEYLAILKSGVDPVKLKEFVALAAGMSKKPED